MGVQVTGSNLSPLEDFTPILPIVGGSGDAPPPSDNSGDKGDGDEGVSEEPEDPMEPMDEGDFITHVYLEPQRRVSLHVRSCDTIAVLKVHLQHMLGINRQRLPFMGGLRDLEDGRTLDFYDIEENEVLELTIRGRGGGKRGRTETVSKRLVMAQIHGGIELLFATTSDEVRQERRRIDDDYREWDLLDALPSATLNSIVRKISAMNYNISERRIAEILQPQTTPLAQVIRGRVEALENDVDLLTQQCTLSVTRLLMDDDGCCGWKGFRAMLQSKLDRRLGLEAAAPPVAAAALVANA